MVLLGLGDCAFGRPSLAAVGGAFAPSHQPVLSVQTSPLFPPFLALQHSPQNIALVLSHMFHPANNIPSNLGPINTCVQFLVDKPTNSDILPSYEIQPVADLCARFFVIRRSYDALHGLREDEVGDLITGKESAGEGSTVGGENQYFF